MNPEDKKYIWWGLLGIGVAALFYFLSMKNNSGQTNTVTVPYLVPQTTTGASPTTDQSLSNQPNIIGSSSNSQVPNFSNPLGSATSVGEAPNTFGFMPNLIMSPVNTVPANVHSGVFPTVNGATTQVSQATGGLMTITPGGFVTQ